MLSGPLAERPLPPSPEGAFAAEHEVSQVGGDW